MTRGILNGLNDLHSSLTGNARQKDDDNRICCFCRLQMRLCSSFCKFPKQCHNTPCLNSSSSLQGPQMCLLRSPILLPHPPVVAMLVLVSSYPLVHSRSNSRSSSSSIVLSHSCCINSISFSCNSKLKLHSFGNCGRGWQTQQLLCLQVSASYSLPLPAWACNLLVQAWGR